jgi:hypothetical protein
MAYIFDTINTVGLSGTRVQISHKDMNWTNRELKSNPFKHEKIDTTPHLSVRVDVPSSEAKRISDYIDNFWSKASPAKSGNIRLTNAQLYEYQLRQVIDDAVEKLELDWKNRLEKRVSKMLDTQKELA